METTKASSGILTPNLFIKGTEGEEIDKEFICKICNSIALKPKMCKSCDHLYCSDCIENPQEQKCKNRDCGRESIGDPNKFMLRTLYSFKFKCKYPDCPVISSYEEFLIHYETCSFKQCPDPQCQENLKTLKEKLDDQVQKNQQLENQMMTLRNTNKELKDQLVTRIQSTSGDTQRFFKAQQEIIILKEQIQKKEEENRVLKMQNMFSTNPFQAIIQKIKCPQQHQLVPTNQHPYTNNSIICDICYRNENLCEKQFFFRCQSTCGYDMCANCYFLHMADKKDVIEKLKQEAQIKKRLIEEQKAGTAQSQLLEQQMLRNLLIGSILSNR